MNRPKFAPPRIPQPRSLMTFTEFKTQTEDLLIGLGFEIRGHHEDDWNNSIEYLSDRAVAGLSLLDREVNSDDLGEILTSKEQMNLPFAVYVSGSGFSAEAVSFAKQYNLFIYKLSIFGKFEPMTEVSGYLTTMGGPALNYGMQRGPEEVMNIITEMYPHGR